MHKNDLQEIIAQFTLIGTIDQQIFTKENITDNDKAGIEKVVFHICKRNLYVVPRLIILLIKGLEYQLITEIKGYEKTYCPFTSKSNNQFLFYIF